MSQDTRSESPQDRYSLGDPALLPAAQRAVYNRIVAGRGKLPAPYPVLLASPAVADLFEKLSSTLWEGLLAPKILEAIFLLTAHHQKCRYQWHNHLGRARAAGVDEAAILKLGTGDIPTGPEDLAIACRFARSLYRNHVVDQSEYDAAHAQFGADGLAELVAFCGVATSISLLLNVRQIGTPADADIPF